MAFEGDALEIRPPLQQRSREAWERILDAGVTLLEEGGYEAFTIAAVCERAQVVPRAVYARVNTKEGLFLATYEHGIARFLAEHEVFTDARRWAGLSPEQLIHAAVRALVGINTRYAAFLRAIVLISGVHPEVYRRGAGYSRRLGEAFTGLLLTVRGDIDHLDPEAAVWAAFDMAFSTLILRITYGPAFATPPTDDDTFAGMLADMLGRSLLR
ncbi:TetR/AcrR family transcriptional regulator [Actinoplanes sp. OR16]|uniref:TetR/AcrR family transcriptional regulator n=1 Tax=Actinoplanes sp. OR16 TaxID=946334 RepID=UPI000FD9F371|nr:TetR/AcrR family transcriptional regulator [Actinoplanes sp. OR16]